MAVYQGRGSGYAYAFGLYVRRLARSGVDTFKEALALATMVCWDYHQGVTADSSGRKMRMSKELFRKRLEFIKSLERIHRAPKEVREKTDKLIKYCLRHKKPPKTAAIHGKRVTTKAVLRKMLVPINEEGRRVKERIIKWVG